MKLNIKSIGILLALTFSTKVNANGTSSKVVPSKTQTLSTVTVSSKTIPTLTNTNTNTVTTKIPPMITTTVVYMPEKLHFSYGVYELEVPNNVEKVLAHCNVHTAKALPTSICDKKSTCFGKYTTFTERHSNIHSSAYNNLCEVFTHKSNEPTPTTGYLSTDLCTPVITKSTYDKIYTVYPRSTTTKFGEEGYFTEYTTYTVYPTSYPTEWASCHSYATSTIKMIPRDIKATTGKTIPTTTTTTTGKTIPTTTTTTGKTIPTTTTTTTTTGKTIPTTTTTTTGKTIPTTTTTTTGKTIPTTTTTGKNVPFISTTVTYYASATPGYEIFFNTTVIEVPATVKKVQMNCSFFRSSKTIPNRPKTLKTVSLTPRTLSSSYPQEEILSNNVESNYYDSCNNYYGIYTTIPFTIREKGSCTVLTHNGNEKLAQKSTSICAPALKPYQTSIRSLVDSYTTTLKVISKTTVIEEVTTYKSTATISYYTACNYCPTSQPLTTTTSTTTTKTTTTTTSSSTVTTTTTFSSTPTSSSSVTTSITSTKCLPVYVTVTEKEKVTVTEKETITVTVKSSSNPTIIDNDDDRKCADKWAQCGGVGFTGPTCCKQGYHCHELNQYYSQCI